MHRTQVLIDDWQYAALKARAEREGRSLSEILRELIAAQLSQQKSAGNNLSAIEGIGEDRAAYGRDHDQHLYGKPEK